MRFSILFYNQHRYICILSNLRAYAAKEEFSNTGKATAADYDSICAGLFSHSDDAFGRMANLQTEFGFAFVGSQTLLRHFENLVTDFFQLTVALAYSCMIKRHCQQSSIIIWLDYIDYMQFTAKLFAKLYSSIQCSPGAFTAIYRNKNLIKHNNAPP